MDSGDSSDEGPTWQKDRVLGDWESSMEYAQHVLVGGKTKLRILFLQDELLSLAKHAGRSIIRAIVFVVFTTKDLNLSQIMDIFRLLTLTYPRYLDARSREAVEAVGMELIRRDEMRGLSEGMPTETKFGVAEQIVGWLSNEVGRLAKRSSPRWGLLFNSYSSLVTSIFSSYASSDIFVLLSWSCGIYNTCVTADSDFPLTNTWRLLLGTLATLLDMLSGCDNAKKSVVNGALVRVRRALRSVRRVSCLCRRGVQDSCLFRTAPKYWR